MIIPKNIASKVFSDNKYAYFEALRENSPVYRGKLLVMNATFLSRYQDCADLLRDDRFIRNRSVALGGGGRLPIPLPKAVALLSTSMITEDNPAHRRLRLLVNKAFTPSSLTTMEQQIEDLTNKLLDEAEPQGTVDLLQAYALPIPVKVIAALMGVSDDDMPRFKQGVRVLTEGMSGWGIARTILWDMPRVIAFCRELIDRKRAEPGPDVLSSLIAAEEEGEKLNEDELIAMIFLLIFAGYETTVHLIGNGVLTLLQHPQQLEKLRANPELAAGAVEEMLRYCGPIHGTKPNYAIEDVELHGVTIKKGSMVIPLLGSANRDPRFFNNPDVFDIERTPNKHLGFGYGIHLCLGAWLARLETKVAITTLLRRNPEMQLAVKEEELQLQQVPLWHRYQSLPVRLR